MVQAISKHIVSLGQVHERFGLRRSNTDRFFTEWREDLVRLNAEEKARLDLIKQRYDYQQADSPMLEETVKMLIVSPLLDLAGFYEPPFRFRAETAVSFEFEDEEEIQGRIDALVIQQRFWVLVVEAKQTKASIEVGIPQLLTYMMANPNSQQPVFGLVTNGSSFAFAKVFEQAYDFSDVYSLISRRNQLYDVLSVLKKIGTLIVPA
ncbi:type I restriction endonuclease [Leptolyngbya sp. AN03gr2]|uniref:type I restriction endonuclease n=1 Tax=unclassified Leptolyngbya TaxID=2650499 RepID=UPI003D312C99